MACYNHPDREAVATCSVCGRDICSDCYVEIGGNSYCKNCLNALINSNITEKTKQEQSNTIENIEPITKPKTIPFEEEVETKEVPIETPEIITPVEKAPENYEPEYDYETEYVETYGDEDSEDSYYENPESIPEPEPEYKKKMVADPIIPIKQEQKEVYEEPIVPETNNIESKYERYLEDLYYDEEPNYNRGRRNQYEEPIYVDRQNYDNEPNYPRYADDDLDYIVPVHQSRSRNDGPSYEEIKRRIETEREYGQGYDERSYREPAYNRDFGYERPRGPRQNLEDIQRMHSYEQYDKEDNSFTALEIALTIILIILIIIVVFYIVYLFALSSTYPTVIDAVQGLVQNPSLFLTNLINH